VAVKEAPVAEPAIAVRGLRKSFGAKEAVAGIDQDIAAAEQRLPELCQIAVCSKP
jgi:hypothetical protein